MADGHVPGSFYVIALFFLGITPNAGKLSFEKWLSCTRTPNLEFGLYGQSGKPLMAYLTPVPARNNSRHDFKVYRAEGYLSARVSRYPNSASTFQKKRLITRGDIAENPGLSTNKQTCPECSRTIAKNHRSLTCSVCDLVPRSREVQFSARKPIVTLVYPILSFGMFSKITWSQINSGPTARGTPLNYCWYISRKSGEQQSMPTK